MRLAESRNAGADTIDFANTRPAWPRTSVTLTPEIHRQNISSSASGFTTPILPVEGKLGPDGKAAPPLMADLFQMLVRDRVTFQSAIFMFHGKSGTLRMDGDDMGVNEWKWYFADKGLDRLFPNAMSRLYFPGCDVADGEDGWKFLETAGSILLRGHGGLSYGWTSLGFAVPSWMPWIGDHAVHPWGETRYVIVSPGGALKRVDD